MKGIRMPLYTTPGTFSLVVPAGMTRMPAQSWAAGGGGAEDGGAGGGGGHDMNEVDVVPGQTVDYTVGAPGLSESHGGPTQGGESSVSLDGTLVVRATGGSPANGSLGGLGGTGTIGTTHTGGKGADGAPKKGGGGGGGARAITDGVSATDHVGGAIGGGNGYHDTTPPTPSHGPGGGGGGGQGSTDSYRGQVSIDFS